MDKCNKSKRLPIVNVPQTDPYIDVDVDEHGSTILAY